MKMVLTEQRCESLEKISDKNGVTSALVPDQRGALRRLMTQYQDAGPTIAQAEELKVLVVGEPTEYAFPMLLDPEYGPPATKALDREVDLLLAREEAGYDTSSTKCLSGCLDAWPTEHIKERDTNTVKFLSYYNINSSDKPNRQRQAYIECVSSECVAEDIPFFLEILVYDEEISDAGSTEYIKVKPRRAIEAIKVFSDLCFNIDVLKVEVPVSARYVEGFADGEVVCSETEVVDFFKAQEEATNLPYIYLSAGVSAKSFQETLQFAHDLSTRFNGVLCERTTWVGFVGPYIKEGEKATREWLCTTRFGSIGEPNKALIKTASPWTDKV